MSANSPRSVCLLLAAATLIAAGTVVLAADSLPESSAKNAGASDPNGKLVWKKKGENLDYSSALDLQPVTGERPRLGYQKLDEKGNVVATREGSTFDQKMFIGSDVYWAKLDGSVRGENQYIHFVLGGTVKPTPADGTIINIDGAIIGFSGTRDPETGAGIARVMRLDGQDSWKPTGVNLALTARDDLSGAVKLCVRLSPEGSTWDLFLRDIIVAEGLPLFRAEGPPSISVRAGTKHEDTAILRLLSVRKRPGGRGDVFLKTTEGKLDLEGAYRGGSPWVERADGDSPERNKDRGVSSDPSPSP